MTRLPAALLPALLAFLLTLALYLLLPSTRYSLDGLRVLPGLRTVVPDSGYASQNWSVGYHQPHWYRANVQLHLLHPLHSHVVYALARGVGYHGDAQVPLQAANAVAAALTVALLVGLLATQLRNPWLALPAGIGLAFSTAFSAQATNLAEVIPALPWLALAVWLLAAAAALSPDQPGRRTLLVIAAGICCGLSIGLYVITLVVVAVFFVRMLMYRRWRSALLFSGAALVTTVAVYAGVLLAAGSRDLLVGLATRPEYGAYGGWRLSNLLSILLAFARSLWPVLPDDFAGLRGLLHSGQPFPSGLMAVPVALVFAGVFLVRGWAVRSRAGPELKTLAGIGGSIFFAAIVAALIWDPYHSKIWVYANIGFWLLTAALIAHEATEHGPWRLLTRVMFGLLLVSVVGMNLVRMVGQHGVNPKLVAAENVARYVLSEESPPECRMPDCRAPDSGVCFRAVSRELSAVSLVVGFWQPEFCYLSMFLPEANLLSLPDFILEPESSGRPWAARLQSALAGARPAYFLNLLGPEDSLQRAYYAQRLKVPELPGILADFEREARLVFRDDAAGTRLYRVGEPGPGYYGQSR